MSKAECNRSYLRYKNAHDASKRVPKVSNVNEIFKRKPYSSTNFTEKDDEPRRDNE